MISKKILYFSLIFSVVLSFVACVSDSKNAKDIKMSDMKMSYGTYDKARSMGVEVPTKTGKGTPISTLLVKDSIGSPTTHKMPDNCISTDKNTIGKGKFLFENVRGKNVKKPKYGYARKIKKTDAQYVEGRQSWKPYGNCVACHHIGGVKAPGDIGPSLANYKAHFVDTKVRDAQWVFAKISDPRVDNPDTVMSVNHTTFSADDICAIMSFVFNDKS